jgi:hypothetical protein
VPRAIPVTVVETPEFLAATQKLFHFSLSPLTPRAKEQTSAKLNEMTERNDFKRLTALLVATYGSKGP